MLIDRNTFDLSKFWNRYGVVRAYASGKAVNPAKPVELVLEVTDHCNLECPMCPRPNMTRPLGHMSMDLFKSLIDQVKDYIELVMLTGGLGEPFMHPQIFEMIEYAVKSGVRLGLSTNATLLSERLVDRFLDCPTNLIFLSLDGATKETHEKIRLGSNFERTMGNVERLVTEKVRRGLENPYTIVQMVYMPQNRQEASAFNAKWRGFSGINDIRLKQFLYLDGAEWTPGTEEVAQSKLSCILPWRQLSISWDGTLALCCRDLNFKDSMGSVKTQSILELWNAPKMVRYRELLASGRKSEIPQCAGCPTLKTTPLTRLASTIVDDYSIRKLLPYAEKFAVKTGIDITSYS